MTPVYIVTSEITRDEYAIAGVFSTRELAETFIINRMTGSPRLTTEEWGWEIEEWELDKQTMTAEERWEELKVWIESWGVTGPSGEVLSPGGWNPTMGVLLDRPTLLDKMEELEGK